MVFTLIVQKLLYERLVLVAHSGLGSGDCAQRFCVRDFVELSGGVDFVLLVCIF